MMRMDQGAFVIVSGVRKIRLLTIDLFHYWDTNLN